MSFHSPKNRFRVELNYAQPIEGIGSASSFTCNEMDANEKHPHPMIQHHIEQAGRNGVALSVKWLENKATYPAFDWVEMKSYTIEPQNA